MNFNTGNNINRYAVLQNTIRNSRSAIKPALMQILQGVKLTPEAISSKTESIRNKLKTGKELTPKEKAFLKEHNPELYDKVLKLDAERERYRLELQACNSKEDAQRLHSQKTLSCMRGIKQGDEFSYFLYKVFEDEYIKNIKFLKIGNKSLQKKGEVADLYGNRF